MVNIFLDSIISYRVQYIGLFSPLVTMNSKDNNLETIDVLKCNQPEQRNVFVLSDSTVVNTDNTNSKRQLSEGSSLSSPFPPPKRPNVRENEFDLQSPSDPFSPSACEVIDSNFQELIRNVLTTDSMVHDLITHIVESTVKQRTLEQEEQICYLQGMVDSLTSKVHQLEEKIEKQQVVSDHLEQYSRRHSVRIVNNWPEEPDEDTDMKVVGMVNDCLNIGIDREDIDRSHRVGRPSANKPRPVIAKFIEQRLAYIRQEIS